MSYELECQIDLRRQRKPKAEPRSTVKVPPVLKTLVLAHQIEQALVEGRAKSFGEIARQFRVSQPRITQIMTMLRLSPALQEQILSADWNDILKLSETQVRQLVKQTSKDRQASCFQRLLS